MFLASGCDLLGHSSHSGGSEVPSMVLTPIIMEGACIFRNRAGRRYSPYAHTDSILTIWAVNPGKGGTSKVEEWGRVFEEGNGQGKLSGSPRKVGRFDVDSCSIPSSMMIFMWCKAFGCFCHLKFCKNALSVSLPLPMRCSLFNWGLYYSFDCDFCVQILNRL